MRQSHKNVDGEFLNLWFCVYDGLVDDDEDTRDEAAKIVAHVIPSKRVPNETAFQDEPSLTPVAALDRFLGYIAEVGKDSSLLCIEALSRTTGFTFSSQKSQGQGHTVLHAIPTETPAWNPRPIPQILKQAMKPNTTLFVEEKQNLFVDEVQEAERWAGILKSLSSTAVHSSLIPILETWIAQGFGALSEMAEVEEGGPLGWTSKSEVFLLGMRILFMADVLLDWGRRGFMVADSGGVRTRLEELAEVGQRRGLHGLWMAKIADLLQSRHQVGK